MVIIHVVFFFLFVKVFAQELIQSLPLIVSLQQKFYDLWVFLGHDESDLVFHAKVPCLRKFGDNQVPKVICGAIYLTFCQEVNFIFHFVSAHMA